ncbi:MAG: DUF3786 domain-containing protein [Desulfobulbaceae bacterium]|jgi:hypothetical protein|nr:DUF3786 domain-containing protein [Desulfobulbaceae bacterium]
MEQWIDEQYFAELAQAKPEKLCAGGRAAYDPATGRYRIRIWNEDYTFDGRNRLVSVAPTASSTLTEEFDPERFSVFVIWYLLHPMMAVPHTGTWISENDFPGGNTFFRGPHQIPGNKVAVACDGNLGHFTAAGQRLGGEKLTMGDAAFRFAITPDIAVAVLLWLGDEDFPAEAKVLFDQGLIGKLPLDLVWSLASGVCKRLSGIIKAQGQAA